ncbi:MAG: hypothetical protein AB1762_09460 [Gemmatimonadota bacterium]
MNKTIPALPKSLAVLTAALLLGCADTGPVTPNQAALVPVQDASVSSVVIERAVSMLRRATARYHDLNVALADGFVLLHPCEVRPGEGAVGAVYVNLSRLDGRVDLDRPEALIYEESPNQPAKLVGAEFAIPYVAWPKSEPPVLLGQTFQAEDEFGVFALHAWIWRANPNGMFAEAHPGISCTAA